MIYFIINKVNSHINSDGHRSFFTWIGDLDPLFILLCDPFPDPDPKFLNRSRYYLYI